MNEDEGSRQLQQADQEKKLLKFEIKELEQRNADFEILIPHMKRMVRTLGNSTDRQLRWLVAFLHTDFTSLPKTKIVTLQCELAFLASFGNRTFKKKAPIPSGFKYFDPYRDFLCLFSGNRLLPSQDVLNSCQSTFSQNVSTFLNYQPIQFPLSYRATIHLINSPKNDPFLYVGCSSSQESLQWWFASLLAEQGRRLRRCPTCLKIYIAHRVDMKFCADKCRAKYNMRRQRGTTKDRYGKRGRPKKVP